MAQFARACVTTVPAFQRRCGTVCLILSSLLKPKGWEWAWQLCDRLLNRTAARSQLKTLMEMARGLDLSFRLVDLRHDPSNSIVFLIDDDASVRKGVLLLLRSPSQGAPHPCNEKNWASWRSLISCVWLKQHR